MVRWGKSKCGATVCRLVGGVAPLLFLLKRWLFFSFFVCRFIVALSFFTMTANSQIHATPSQKTKVWKRRNEEISDLLSMNNRFDNARYEVL